MLNPDATVQKLALNYAKYCPKVFKEKSDYELFMLSRQFNEMDKTAQENMLAKISILGKISSEFNRINANKFLAEDMPSAVKIKEFIENAEPKFLIKLSNVYSGGSKTLEEMFANVNIDQYVKNAKLHKQLPKKLLDRLDDFSTEFEYNIDSERLSLWKELSVMLFLIAYCVASSFKFLFSDKSLSLLSVYFVNSKRKRIPMLSSFASANKSSICEYLRNFLIKF